MGEGLINVPNMDHLRGCVEEDYRYNQDNRGNRKADFIIEDMYQVHFICKASFAIKRIVLHFY